MIIVSWNVGTAKIANGEVRVALNLGHSPDLTLKLVNCEKFDRLETIRRAVSLVPSVLLGWMAPKAGRDELIASIRPHLNTLRLLLCYLPVQNHRFRNWSICNCFDVQESSPRRTDQGFVNCCASGVPRRAAYRLVLPSTIAKRPPSSGQSDKIQSKGSSFVLPPIPIYWVASQHRLWDLCNSSAWGPSQLSRESSSFWDAPDGKPPKQLPKVSQEFCFCY